MDQFWLKVVCVWGGGADPPPIPFSDHCWGSGEFVEGGSCGSHKRAHTHTLSTPILWQPC